MKARLPQGMGGGAQNMNSMVKQAQKMQDQILKLQEDIEQREFTATSGGGAVTVDIEMLQDLIISAVNEAVKQIEDTSEKEMAPITGGISFPGLF